MSIDDDLAMLLSKLPEPETLTSKGPTWPAAVHLIVRVLLAIRADMQWPKERGWQAQAAPGRTWTDVERQRVAGLLSAAFGTTGPIEEQVAVIRGLLQGARMEANATLRDTAECRGSLHRIGIAHDEGVKLWRSADPERRSMMLPPMRAELVVWLLEQLTEARLDAAGRQELERQVQHEQARWARIQPVIRALHLWEVSAGSAPETSLRDAFEAWQKAEAAALDGKDTPPVVAPFVPCDGEHAAPACPDAQCWRREKPAEVTMPGKVSARPADGAVRTLPDRVYRLIAYVEEMARQIMIMIDGGQHGLSRIVLSPDAALQYGVTPGNPMTARVGVGDVEIATTGAPLAEASRPTDPTTASIEAGARERADLREQLRRAIEARDYAFEERDRANGRAQSAMAEVVQARGERAEALAQRQKLLDEGLAARLLADAMLEAVKPLLPNGCKLDPDSIRIAIDDYADAHDNLVRAVKVLAKELQ